MTDFNGLFCEIVTNIIILVTQTFLLLKLVSMFGARIICLVTHTLLLLVKVITLFHADICWRMIIWAVAFVSLPIRVLTALQRERMLEMHLHEMQITLGNLAWDKKELEERLHIANKDRKIMESILEDLEEEHDKAISKIELLENKCMLVQLQDLEDENLRLNEIQGKNFWNLKVQDDPGGCRNIFDFASLKSSYKSSGVIIQDLMHRDACEAENKGKSQPHEFEKIGLKRSGHDYPFPSTIVPIDKVLDKCREVALSQSLFSATLSLVVGIIIWEAEDPCVPLVVALFSVVGMSLKSVVQFFSTIKNKPASDAVALLSFNWFILGTLTYPTLPRLAHLLSPLAQSVTNITVVWLGFSISQ